MTAGVHNVVSMPNGRPAAEPFSCACCNRETPVAQQGALLHLYKAYRLCLDCYQRYASMQSLFPEQNMIELIAAVRTQCSVERLSPLQQEQLQRLQFLLNNGNGRARNLLDRATAGQISLAQLLDAI